VNYSLPKYRITSVVAIPKAHALEQFSPLLNPDQNLDAQLLNCADDATLSLRDSGRPGFCYLQVACKFAVSPTGVSLGRPLSAFIRLCQAAGSPMRSLRNGSILTGEGGVLSDVFWSMPFRRAQHLASHPKDKPAVCRWTGSQSNNSFKPNPLRGSA
jgi:hypothetical protein